LCSDADTNSGTGNAGKEIAQYLQSRTEQSDDELFLKSPKPMLARVREHCKFEFKMAIMNLTHSFETPVCETVATPASDDGRRSVYGVCCPGE